MPQTVAARRRIPEPGGEPRPMLRSPKVLSESDLERELLRKGVGAMVAGRHECSDCGRTPLVGERVFRFGRGSVVCALCAAGTCRGRRAR